MTDLAAPASAEKRTSANNSPTPVTGGIYGLAFIGAVVYYIQHATGFWEGAWGILKAMVWPAILIYELFDFLKL